MNALPEPTGDWAMLLDVDGTLVELADYPDAVRPDPNLATILHNLTMALNGAVALVSGRRIADTEQIVGRSDLAMAGLHGLEVRSANGDYARSAGDGAGLERARAALRKLTRKYPGLLLEDKTAAVALHYRSAPAARSAAIEAGTQIVRQSAGALELLTGKSVVEVKPAGSDKGQAVHALLAEAPFRGRTPVYIGDDVTDEHAFEAINELGGTSIRVGNNHKSAAHYSLARPTEVLEWLQQITTRLTPVTKPLT